VHTNHQLIPAKARPRPRVLLPIYQANVATTMLSRFIQSNLTTISRFSQPRSIKNAAAQFVFFAQNPKSIKTERTSSKLPQKSPKTARFPKFFSLFLTFSHFFARFRAFSPPIGVFVHAILPPKTALSAQKSTQMRKTTRRTRLKQLSEAFAVRFQRFVQRNCPGPAAQSD